MNLRRYQWVDKSLNFFFKFDEIDEFFWKFDEIDKSVYDWFVYIDFEKKTKNQIFVNKR